MNWKLFLNILSSVNGGLITGAALLNPLVGESLALKIISGLGICQIIVSAVNSNLSTQANTIKEVAAMPGIDPLSINKQANATVAALALDPANHKIAPALGATPTLESIAKG